MSSKQTIMIVDDDLNVLEVLQARLTSNGYQVIKATSGTEAINLLKSKHIDLLISDMKMPGMDGMDLFQEVRTQIPNLPVIFLTAFGSIPDAVHAVKAGAVDYLAKPFEGHELLKKLRQVLNGKQENHIEDQHDKNDGEMEKSPAMKDLHNLINKVAVSNVNVLILGESGSGKEHAARLIHEKSSRRDNPFVVVDCGSTPTGLLESELFGHVKGAFTHAIRDKKGLIEEANQGTLFLDEIGNISPEMQVRLLRFLENRKIRRIGDLRELSIDCRVIAATNSDLLGDIKEGRFREDLYYRLRVVTLKVPTLKERKEDISFLATFFVENFCRENDLPAVELPPETTDWLCNYPWPGNVRELKNALEAGIVLCQSNVLLPDDLQLTGLPEIEETYSEEANSFSLEESERNTIIRALQQTDGVQKNAAELLGISRRAIHYKIKKFEIDISQIKSDKKKIT